MISFGWLDRLLNINNNPIEIKFRDPITGEEAVVISKRLLRDTISEAYEAGANAHYNGCSMNQDRDEYTNSVCEELHL